MKVLVIPDCHLKPYMFTRAAELLKDGIAERAVYLGDTPDDWDKQYIVRLYEETFDALINFVKEFPDTLLCYGNHDLSYMWYQLETGYSPIAERTVREKITELEKSLPEDNPMKYVQRIDNVLFSHGGLSKYFVNEYVPVIKQKSIDATLDVINSLGKKEMWNDDSPIWLRPQYEPIEMYKASKFLQVVGHTPMKNVERKDNLISCDVFSTHSNGEPIGTCEYVVIDTENFEMSLVGTH